MQVQAVTKKRTDVQVTAGIDVGKDWLDVYVHPVGTALRVPNSESGFGELKRFLLKHKVDLVAIEPTGRYHRAAQASLTLAGLAVAVVNPYQLRCFARANQTLAKNDRLDARVLALFAMAMKPDVRPPAPEVLIELGELMRARMTAVAELTSLKNQMGSATIKFLASQFKRRIDRIKADIQSLDNEMQKRIGADPSLARRFEILTSIPGVGPTTAETLIISVSELGTLTPKSVAKILGVAPLDRDSGKMQGRRTCWGGRAEVRKIVYMAAVSASKSNPSLKAYFERLMNNGKAFKQAIVAVIRKLAILANTLIAEDRLWQIEAPKQA